MTTDLRTTAVDAVDVVDVAGPSTPAASRPPRWRRLLARPEWVFVIVAAVIGLSYACIAAPLTGADERDQFDRAYMVAEGQVFATWRHGKVGGTFPDTLDEELGRVTRRVYTDLDRTSFLDFLDRPAPTGRSQFEDVGLFATYGPAPYLPAALGIDVGRVFGASALAMTYLARILQVVAYIAIVALAIRRIPVHKWIVVVAALVPAVLFQAASVSADALTIALAFLVVAEALRLIVTPPGAVTRAMIVETGVAGVLLGLSKPPYVALVLLLVVPAVRHREALAKRLAAVMGTAIAVGVGWAGYSLGNTLDQEDPRRWFVPPRAIYKYAYQGLDQGGQLRHAVTHPWDFAGAIFESIGNYGMKLLEWVWGLGPYEIPVVLTSLVLVALFATLFMPNDRPEPVLPRATRLGLLVLTIGIGLVILLWAYVAWNRYRAPLIENVPGRFWMPLLPAFLLGLAPAARRVPAAVAVRWRIAVAGAVAAILVVTVVGLVHHHYTGAPILAPVTATKGG